MKRTSHEKIKDTLYDYAGGKLDSETSERVKAHISGCPECEFELEEIRNTLHLLEQTYENAPASLCAGVIQGIEKYEKDRKKNARRFAIVRWGSFAASFAVKGLMGICATSPASFSVKSIFRME